MNDSKKTVWKLGIKEKKDINPLTWRIVDIEEGVKALQAMPRSTAIHETYSYHFDVKKFTAKQARSWLSDRGLEERRLGGLMTNIGNLGKL